MTTMTETKDPRTLITGSGWCYQIVVESAQYAFNYQVAIYGGGRKITTSYTMTKWGARREARKLRRRYYRRQKMTGETRGLR